MTSRFCPGSFRHTSISSCRISSHQWRGLRLPLGMPLKSKCRTNSCAGISSRSMCWRIPHINSFRIEIVGTNQPLSPLEPPFAHHLDHRTKCLSGFRQHIDVPSALFLRIGLNDTSGRQFLQALRKHGSGDQRDGRQEIAIGSGAIIELANDQRRPSIAEYLGRLRDGTELTVSDHELNDIRGRRQATSLVAVLALETQFGLRCVVEASHFQAKYAVSNRSERAL